MIIIDIDFNGAEMEANKRAQQMLSYGLYNRFGTNYNNRLEHAKIGCIGEIAFEELLKQMGVQYKTDREGFENRNADKYDFEINGIKIDIKVAKTDKTPLSTWTYGYPQQQVGMEKDVVIVGWVSEKQKTIGLYGWLPFAQITKYPLKYYNSFAGFKYQTPNYEFPWGNLNQDFDELFKIIKRRGGI